MRHAPALSTLLAALVSALAPAAAFARQSAPPTWIELDGSGSGGGISNNANLSRFPSMALMPSGYPVVAWEQSVTNFGNNIHLRRWDGVSWVQLGGSATGMGISTGIGGELPDVAVDAAGNVVVAWHAAQEIYLRRWNGSTWEELGGSGSGGGISNSAAWDRYPRVAVDGNGDPWVVWESGDDVHLRRWNGSSWVDVGGSAGATGINNTALNASWPSIALDPDGIPVVAWCQYMGSVGGISNHDIYVRRWSGSAWVEMGGSASGLGISNTTPGSGQDPRIAIGSDGYPVVVWREEVTGGANEVWLRRWNGSAWEELGGSASGGGVSNTALYSYWPFVALDADGNPVVAWGEGNASNPYEIHVRRWDGANWIEMEGSASGGGISAAPENSERPSLALTPQGDILVAWGDNVSGNREIWVRGRFGARVAAVNQLDGAAPMPVGGTLAGSPSFQATVSSSVFPESLRLEIEVRPLGDAFTGTPTHQSSYFDPDSVVSITVSGLAAGSWHWRARAVNTAGVESPWFAFGDNPEDQADFLKAGGTPPPPPPPTPTPTPSGGSSGGGGGGGGGCGLTGLEAVLFVIALRAGIRRARRRHVA